MSKTKTDGRKKETNEKSSSKVIKKKLTLKQLISAAAEERPNKHPAYIKVSQDGKIDALQFDAVNGKDQFYLGTYDLDLVMDTIARIGCMISRGKPLSEISTLPENAALAAINEIDPQDSTELMLASQMVTAHIMALHMSTLAMLDGQTIEGIDKLVNLANKLMRTFSTQVEALNKYRTKGQQKITVQHINVTDGGQAIVGDVSQGGGSE